MIKFDLIYFELHPFSKICLEVRQNLFWKIHYIFKSYWNVNAGNLTRHLKPFYVVKKLNCA